MEIRLEGVHGTCKSRCARIRTGRFLLGSGRGGKGAYFWRKGHYSDVLARGWHVEQKDKGEYSKETEPLYCGLICALKVDESEFLDLDDEAILDKMSSVYSAQYRGRPPIIDTKEISAFHDAFIKDLEIEMSTKFKVLQKRVPPPQSKFCPTYPLKVVGNPTCYIARDASCISILN